MLLSWRFMLNLVLILLITCWVPLLSQTMEMRDSNGNLIQQVTKVSRAYQSWWVVLRLAPGAKSHAQAVALHFGLCFIITFSVWFIRMYRFHGTMNGESSERLEASDKENNTTDNIP